jgi:hypothetical protein
VNAARLLREPLLHFFVIGGALLALDAVRGGVETGDEARVVRTGAGPDGADRVRDEILYREALSLGLDRGDLIVRRRLIQKMEFILEDTADIAPPTEDDLAAHLAANAERYRIPAERHFEHVYFSRDRRGDRARADAEAALVALRRGESGSGDWFALGRQFGPGSEASFAHRLGAELAAAVMQAPVGEWSGPARSTYGLHLIRVLDARPTRIPTLDEVRARVSTDVVRARSEAAQAAAFERLRARYEVVE